MSSPGAGKTRLLERTLQALGDELAIGVIEADIQTTLDAERIERAGVRQVHQIVTHGACHIDANMLANALDEMDLAELDLLVVENVGNLVCPAEFDLGEDRKVVLYAVTEGEEKPLKYPLMFREAQVLLVNKIDLLPHLEVDLARIHANARQINPSLAIFDVACTSGQGLERFYDWLRAEVERKRARAPDGPGA